jgi:hypothetical protein
LFTFYIQYVISNITKQNKGEIKMRIPAYDLETLQCKILSLTSMVYALEKIDLEEANYTSLVLEKELKLFYQDLKAKISMLKVKEKEVKNTCTHKEWKIEFVDLNYVYEECTICKQSRKRSNKNDEKK